MSEAQVFIDHLTIPVRDPEASRRFYRQALAPFGVEEVELEGGVGWGPPSRVDFFIRQGEPTAPLHLAFAAPDRATVDAFHAAALDAAWKASTVARSGAANARCSGAVGSPCLMKKSTRLGGPQPTPPSSSTSSTPNGASACR